jgi:hypothetical protein
LKTFGNVAAHTECVAKGVFFMDVRSASAVRGEPAPKRAPVLRSCAQEGTGLAVLKTFGNVAAHTECVAKGVFFMDVRSASAVRGEPAPKKARQRSSRPSAT